MSNEFRNQTRRVLANYIFLTLLLVSIVPPLRTQETHGGFQRSLDEALVGTVEMKVEIGGNKIDIRGDNLRRIRRELGNTAEIKTSLSQETSTKLNVAHTKGKKRKKGYKWPEERKRNDTRNIKETWTEERKQGQSNILRERWRWSEKMKKNHSTKMKAYWKKTKNEGATRRKWKERSEATKEKWRQEKAKGENSKMVKAINLLVRRSKERWKQLREEGNTQRHKEVGLKLSEYWRKQRELGITRKSKRKSERAKQYWKNMTDEQRAARYKQLAHQLNEYRKKEKKRKQLMEELRNSEKLEQNKTQKM
uniref:Uncharacterized protein n=1 Tax=Cacopsylla melanoneura TaxID=428564 RepID=A0A8D9E6R8_9HEMI